MDGWMIYLTSSLIAYYSLLIRHDSHWSEQEYDELIRDDKKAFTYYHPRDQLHARDIAIRSCDVPSVFPFHSSRSVPSEGPQTNYMT